MSAPIVIKRKGSGSVQPKFPSPAILSAVPGAATKAAGAAGGQEQDYNVQGFVTFSQGLSATGGTDYERWTRYAQWMDGGALRREPIIAWAAESNIPDLELAALNGLLDEYLGPIPTVPPAGTAAVSVPLIATNTVLHRRGSKALALDSQKRLLLHVTWQWLIIEGYTRPFEITAEWAAFAPRVNGMNAMSQFLERKSDVGSIGENEGYGPEAWKVGNVPGDMAANLHPWPIDENGNNRGIVTVYRLIGPDASGYYGYESGTVIPATFASSASTALTFSGDANDTEVYWLYPHSPARVERNANTEDPAAWFGNPGGNPEGDPDLIPTAEAWLPTPSAETGPYRPGYYYRDGVLVMAIAGQNNGLFSEERPIVDVDGYPCLAAASAEGVITYDWQLIPPTLGPKVMTEQGERFAEAATDRTIRQMWHYSETGTVAEESNITLAVNIDTGSTPEPVHLHPNAVVYVHALGPMEVSPIDDAPVPAVEQQGDWLVLTIPLDALERQGDDYAPEQHVTYRYKVIPYGSIANVPPRVDGTGGFTPSLDFDEYRPYKLEGEE